MGGQKNKTSGGHGTVRECLDTEVCLSDIITVTVQRTYQKRFKECNLSINDSK